MYCSSSSWGNVYVLVSRWSWSPGGRQGSCEKKSSSRNVKCQNLQARPETLREKMVLNHDVRSKLDGQTKLKKKQQPTCHTISSISPLLEEADWNSCLYKSFFSCMHVLTERSSCFAAKFLLRVPTPSSEEEEEEDGDDDDDDDDDFTGSRRFCFPGLHTLLAMIEQSMMNKPLFFWVLWL